MLKTGRRSVGDRRPRGRCSFSAGFAKIQRKSLALRGPKVR